MNDINVDGVQVLIVDDNPANIDILLELLSDYDVRAALDGPSALETVQEEPPSLILLDITMPGMNGFEVCQRLKASGSTKDIPVIFLSASNDETSITTGFNVGGADFITKPYLANEVLARVKTHLRLHFAMKQLEKIAMTDALTGISNRHRFFRRSTKLIYQAQAKKIPLYLAIIDLDKFKPINDTFGHDAGDTLLKNFAKSVVSILPKNNCFARIGGDEFMTILTGSKEAVLQKLEQVRNATKKILLKDPSAKVTASIGVSVLNSTTDESIDQLIARADEALYRSKAKGGDCITSNFE
jgi:diguanylate cyclase (GGDEF)-like protein